ncbi:MAG: 1-phosphofructokinase [Thermoleophilales bacterium]|nr:1-phosphofructokinase [Thermoleophilales bacterium]
MSRVRVAVFAPSPILTVTIEPNHGDSPEIHLHAGGQGFWVARMAASLGAHVVLCCALGGESGRVLEPLLQAQGATEVRAVRTQAENGAYVHDRRSGERVIVAETHGESLARHEVDELYGMIVTAALDCDVTLVTGTQNAAVVDPEIYHRLTRDLRKNGRRALADLSCEQLTAALAGGVELVKVNDDEAVSTGFAAGHSRAELVSALDDIRRAGADNALITRGSEPALALAGDELIELSGPSFEPMEPRGAGDSMFAALGVALAEQRPLKEALRMAAAAGALNATRHGLGSGTQPEVVRLAGHVTVRDVA